ncbi:hypothetical protein F511_17855 [Dorcoceras hygrometricum]|uniref:Uncharacterized protein n=1 Tax=Dorcoceras hygrometricum TaxID=472368 RepID=A0A2Z7C641_9LAMI|nr:hypothetical protein F511_17855 [Dorcoceras hygrometricum]
MRSRAADDAHLAVKCKRTIVGRAASSVKAFRIVPTEVRNQTAAQAKDSVHNLRLEQLNSQELSTSVKSEFDQRIKSLELRVEDLHESHVMMFIECLIWSTIGITIPSPICTRKSVKISRTESSLQGGRNEFRQQWRRSDDEGKEGGGEGKKNN